MKPQAPVVVALAWCTNQRIQFLDKIIPLLSEVAAQAVQPAAVVPAEAMAPIQYSTP